MLDYIKAKNPKVIRAFCANFCLIVKSNNFCKKEHSHVQLHKPGIAP